MLEIVGLTKSFGGLTAVRNVSLTVAAGEVHAVIGPNGAGKSTLANLLTGLFPPSGGKIVLDGKDVTGLPSHRLARLGVGRGWQTPSVFTAFTCLENCLLASRDDWAEADRALETCGLSDRRDRLASALGHGERRQLEIALVLAAKPRLLILDEPLAGLGPDEAARMVALLARLKGGASIILIEHDMDAVFSLADRVTVMADGRVVASGTVDEVRADAAVQAVYLGASA